MKQHLLVVVAVLAALVAPPSPAAGPRPKPVIAVIADNQGTEVTDFLVPFAVTAGSNLAEVHAVALHEGPVMLHPSGTAVDLPPATASLSAVSPEGGRFR